MSRLASARGISASSPYSASICGASMPAAAQLASFPASPRSITVTACPACARRQPIVRPQIPPPMMTITNSLQYSGARRLTSTKRPENPELSSRKRGSYRVTAPYAGINQIRSGGYALSPNGHPRSRGEECNRAEFLSRETQIREKLGAIILDLQISESRFCA